jgi:hypothetical protein
MKNGQFRDTDSRGQWRMNNSETQTAEGNEEWTIQRNLPFYDFDILF